MQLIINSITSARLSLIMLFFILILTACLDSATTTDPNAEPNTSNVNITRQLSGTTSVGSPVAGEVTIIDSKGDTVIVNSDVNGNYTANLEARLGPYLIRIVPDDSTIPVMYSYATGPGVANITPVTTLALFLAYKVDLAAAFTDWMTTSQTWNRSGIEQGLAKINAHFVTDLSNAGVDSNIYDFISDPFVADQTGIDLFFNTYTITIDFATSTFEIIDTSSGQAVEFNETIDTTGFFIGALFLPEDTALWTWTFSTTQNFNGNIRDDTQTIENIPSSVIPINKERFDELFWNIQFPTETISCDDTQVSCRITFQATQFNTDYNVVGNGELGTVVTGTVAYSWSITGSISTPAGGSQTINQQFAWDISWSWERVQ